MTQLLTADQAAELLKPVDSLGCGLGLAWPPEFMAALGEREDWQDLRVDGAHVTVETQLFDRKGVRYRCRFQGPHERAMIARGIRVEFIPGDFAGLPLCSGSKILA